MNKRNFLLFISCMLLTCTTLAAKTEITNVAVPPEVKNIGITVKNNNHPMFKLTQNMNPIFNIKTFINVTVKEFAKTQSMALNDFIAEYCKTHKAKITLVSLSSCYSLIFYKLLFGAHTILSQNNWSAWKEEVPFDVLRVMPQQELAKELLFAVQKQYQTTQNLADFLLPLISFLRDVDHEVKVLNQFITIHQWLDKARLSALFPKQETLVKKAHEKRQRLTYLKGIFLDWVTDYKIAINAPS